VSDLLLRYTIRKLKKR